MIRAVIVFSLLLGVVTKPQAEDVHALTMQGRKMTSAEKDSLEEHVSENPSDIVARTKLLGFYLVTGRNQPGAQESKAQHILWLIENAPESDVLGTPFGQLHKYLNRDAFEKAKEAWLKTLEDAPKNLPARKNAAHFFLAQDKQLCEKLLVEGQKLDPDEPHWHRALGQLYSIGLNRIETGVERTSKAKKAFEYYQKAFQLSDSMEKDSLLSNLTKTAVEAGLYQEAEKYADDMLANNSPGWNQGNRVHHGNLALGRIALAKGDVNEAKSRLLRAGETTGSPQLNSFGPNMLLAKELLEKGEKEVVLEYFELCKQFWTSPRRELEKWIEEVTEGRTPDFGANLAY